LAASNQEKQSKPQKLYGVDEEKTAGHNSPSLLITDRQVSKKSTDKLFNKQQPISVGV
jgi:hypothetical protein